VQSRPPLGLPLEQAPLVAIYADGVKYVLPEEVEITESSMREFWNNFKEGKNFVLPLPLHKKRFLIGL